MVVCLVVAYPRLTRVAYQYAAGGSTRFFVQSDPLETRQLATPLMTDIRLGQLINDAHRRVGNFVGQATGVGQSRGLAILTPQPIHLL